MQAAITTVIVAVVGASAAWAGYLQARKGAQRDAESAERLRQLEQQKQVFDQQQRMFENVEKERDRLQVIVDRLRAEQVEDRRAHAQQLAQAHADLDQCREEIRRRGEELIELHRIVSAQIMASAVVTAAESPDEEDEEVTRIREFVRKLNIVGDEQPYQGGTS